LIISDSLNHASVIHGCRSSGAKIKPYQHNGMLSMSLFSHLFLFILPFPTYLFVDTKHLEAVVREAVIKCQPRTHRPWEKILIIVEGVYSMEGVICPLPDIVRIKKKYKVSIREFSSS
jgi:serine palmitoyltransferase